MVSTKPKLERALLISVQTKGRSNRLWTTEDSLNELGELARSAGAMVVGTMVQNLDRPTQMYLGTGKVEELKDMAQERPIDTVICDDELNPTQQRNLENALGGEIKVIDRTALILDVFAQRAQTKEGRLQVELAQHEYLLPRLAGQWSHLERLGGGIGTRGPGETQIETDRRLVRGRIQRLKKNLEDVRRHRNQSRARRQEMHMPVASLVGYTNAGKSTLLNSLTGAGVVVEDKLFSTLDPITRQIHLPSGRQVLLTDTVGFIQKLPPAVVAAFRATLEEIQDSALILHVLDITHANASQQADVVEGILGDLKLSSKPQILVLNKIDLVEQEGSASPEGAMQDIVEGQQRVVFTSALTGEGTKRLLSEMDEALTEIEASKVAPDV